MWHQVQRSYVVMLCSCGFSFVCFHPRSKDMQITVGGLKTLICRSLSVTCPGVFFCFINIQEQIILLQPWKKSKGCCDCILLKKLFLYFSRATPVRAEAAAAEEEEEQGMKTTRSPPSRPPTTPTPLCCTSWSTSQVTPSTPCLTTACSTPTPTPSCPPSWCPTCWVRTPTSSRGLCTRWVYTFFFLSVPF